MSTLTLIAAVPRSRSAWVANWLARSGVRTLHDPSRGVSSVRDYAQRLVGFQPSEFSSSEHSTIAVDTALCVLWPRLLEVLASEFPKVQVRVATLYRSPTSDCIESLLRVQYKDQPKPFTLQEARDSVRAALLGQDLLRARLSTGWARVILAYDSTQLLIDPAGHLGARMLWDWATERPWDSEAWTQARSFRVTIDAPNMNCYPEVARGLAAEVRPYWEKVSTYMKGNI